MYILTTLEFHLSTDNECKYQILLLIYPYYNNWLYIKYRYLCKSTSGAEDKATGCNTR